MIKISKFEEDMGDSESVDLDEELIDTYEDKSVSNRLKLQKNAKRQQCKENELIRQDTIRRKLPKAMIRIESYDDVLKSDSVIRRAQHNEEITNASIR